MVFDSDRLTKTRLVLVAGLLALAALAILVGDPLAHPEAGGPDGGTKGLTGIPRLAEFIGLIIAFILAFPPSKSSD